MQEARPYTKFIYMNKLHINRTKKALSIIELLAVISIISILAAFAIPAYLSHTVATKLNSLWQLAEPAKLYVEARYLKDNTAVTSVTVTANSKEVTTSGSNLALCISVRNGVVWVVADKTKFNNEILWVAWTPSTVTGSLAWTCTYSATAATYIANSAPNCTVGTAAYSADTTCNQ